MSDFITTDRNGAVFSPCERYRYSLWRWWGYKPEPQPSYMVAFLGLNPSTADAAKNDPTVTRCIGFAKRWGFDGMIMLNLFAHRDTDPKMMKLATNPVGPDNDEAIDRITGLAGMTVCCWGSHGVHLGRSLAVQRLLAGRTLHYLKLTAALEPWHPLYLAGELKPLVWK